MGGNTGEDVTTEINQPIENQHIEQLEPMGSASTPQNFESITMKKKEVNNPNINHENEFKKCMESYNIQNKADSIDIIANAIAFYEGRYNI